MTTMDYTKTMQALSWLKVETGSLACLGCGCENNCSIHGCAILRNAGEHMEAALANYDHLSALVDQQAAEFKLCQKYLADSEAARTELARQLVAARKQVDELTKAGLIATDKANQAIAELYADIRMRWGCGADDLPDLKEEKKSEETDN